MFQNTMSSTILETPAPSQPRQDELAVMAVRQGDVARYRELVERYQRRVYAVAWSRLGDATLAEEATQEAFIRAYRNLPLLGDGAKFPAWISAIARNLAISLGLRHRRELNKRARWALEQPTTTESPAARSEEICSPEILRQTMAELPDAHRECLVLFYLEGKSGAEAAAALGITETALRMRLSRARVALREKLEERLSESLEQLRPPSKLVPSIMAMVTTTKMKAGTGLGTVVMAAMAKVLPFKFVSMVIPAAAMVPGMGLAYYMGYIERKNFLDPKGFRVRLHRDYFKGMIWFIGILMLVNFTAVKWISHWYGFEGILLALGLFSLLMLAFQARGLVINRSWFKVGIFINSAIVTTAMLAVGMGWAPMWAFNIAMMVGALLLIPAMRDKPLRMDYNLFLRASQGMLGESVAEAAGPITFGPQSRPELLAFARFLAERFLVLDFRWSEAGVQLCLPSFKWLPVSQTWEVFTFHWRNRSWIELGRDGAVSAHLGKRDEATMEALDKPATINIPELEAWVATTVAHAWRHFSLNQVAAAERMLGQLPEAEVFKQSPGRIQTMRLALVTLIVLVVVSVGLVVANSGQYRNQRTAKPLQERMVRNDERMQQLTSQINAWTLQVSRWQAQIRNWESQVVSAAPAEVEKLNGDVADLQAKITETNNKINLNNQLVERFHHDSEQLQLEITRLLHPEAKLQVTASQ